MKSIFAFLHSPFDVVVCLHACFFYSFVLINQPKKLHKLIRASISANWYMKWGFCVLFRFATLKKSFAFSGPKSSELDWATLNQNWMVFFLRNPICYPFWVLCMYIFNHHKAILHLHVFYFSVKVNGWKVYDEVIMIFYG